ncbi:MAG TPA: Gfo/Idh/MocA family oxidoreductase [Gaiellaceae bacterium]|nr:Gfo/Idh/MocA family oxidoreductase [Gaiellaceae bacterium]
MGSASASQLENGTAGPLRIGVVGLGAVAQAVHLPLLAKHPDRFAVDALCDLSASTRDALGERYGVPAARRFADAHELIGAGGLDAIAILTSGSHGSLATAAARAGLAIFCEKPLAYTLAELDELEATSPVLQLGYMKLYDPAVERAARVLAGRPAPRSIEVTVLHPPSAPQLAHAGLLPAPADVDAAVLAGIVAGEAAVNEAALGAVGAPLASLYSDVLLGSIVHDLAVIRALAGGPLEVDDADVWPGDAPNGSVSLLGRLPGGTRVSIRWHYLEDYPAYREEVRVHDASGTVEVVFPAPYLLHAPTTLTVVEADGEAERTSTTRSTVEAFERQWLAFAAFVAGGETPRAGLAEGREDVLTCQAAAALLAARLGVEIGGEAARASFPSRDRLHIVNRPVESLL